LPAEDLQAQQSLAATVAEVSERASVLVREEIELAKAEVATKVASLARGAAVAVAAGIFAIFGVVLLLEGVAWGVWALLFTGSQGIWAGFAVTAGGLFLFAMLAGLIAFRAVRRGAPPVPTMAIDEARKIRETVGSGAPSGAA
jgi:uncharacterized small protein (DUF1192 family)